MKAIYKNTPGPQGPMVPAGQYAIKLTVDGKTHVQPLLVRADPRANTPAHEPKRGEGMTMHRHALTLLALGSLLVDGSALLGQDSEKQERAIAEIKKACGWVGVDDKRPGKPVIRVSLDGAPAPSEKWALWIKVFPRLEELSVC